MPIKSFRAKLADGQQLKVRLGTNNGMTGYNIKKFQLFPAQPGAVRQESCVKLYTVAPAAVDAIVNYDDSTLLGSAVITGDTSSHYYPTTLVTVFDHVTFNQDIFITHSETYGSEDVNFYLELEQIKLDMNENTVATLKDIRNIATQG
jgi:hypothetical protein